MNLSPDFARYFERRSEVFDDFFALRETAKRRFAASAIEEDSRQTADYVRAGRGEAEGGARGRGRRAARARRRGVRKPARKRLSYNERRELDALPGRIDALESEIAAIEGDLAAGRIYSSDRLAPAQNELESLVERWAELAERDGGA